MTHRGHRRLTCLALAALAAWALSAPVRAQEKDQAAAFLEGTEVFRRILFEMGFTPLDSFNSLGNDSPIDPADTVLIVLGDTGCLGQFPGGLPAYVRKGGAVLIAFRGHANGE